MVHHKMIRVARGRGPAVEVFRVSKRSPAPVRFRYHGIVKHHGTLMRQRLGFRGPKVVEVAYVPLRKKR